MKTFLRWTFGLALLMTLLGTLAVFGLMTWVADQETLRLFVDGQRVTVTLPQGWSLVGLLSLVALALLLVILLVPALVIVALVLGLLGTLLGGVFALLPVAALVALIVWIARRSSGPRT
mgnify:CR=1 FL=1